MSDVTDDAPRIRALITDDDPLVRRLIRDTLQADNMTVIAEATTGFAEARMITKGRQVHPGGHDPSQIGAQDQTSLCGMFNQRHR